ncbi:MAG: hypothetical protein GY760_23015 [Deltaproteobacteria bacterium]|nr:hypothetical protein [Deltaproteobacteria bacterium]
MKTIELLKNLKDKNIEIEIVNGELDIIVNNDNLSKELHTHIKNNKEELLEYFNEDSQIHIPLNFTYNDLKLKEYKILLIDNELDDSDIDDIYTLSPLQEGFLFHSMMDMESSAYFEQISLDIKGYLDVSLVEKSWQLVVNRHDPLRTMFLSDFKIPLQIVLKNRNIDFSYMDIIEEDNKEKSIYEIRRVDRKNSFDLKTDPLFRIKLIKKEEDQYTLILSFHHIILDGWCMSLIISEFIENYEKLSNNEDISLVSPPRYSEYISWLNNKYRDSDLEYWRSYLDGYEELATVLKDSTCNYEANLEQLNYTFSIYDEHTSALKKIADETGVTLNTIIQTIWGVVLSKYNGTDDVVFGSTVSARPQEIDRIEEMVGLFINTIPVRIKADKDKSFKQVALEVQREALNCIDFHHSSLAEIQGNSRLGSSLLDHIMVFENYPMDKALQGNNSALLEVGKIESFEQSNYDFGITVFPVVSLGIRFSYNPEKYSEELIERIASHIKKAINEIVVDNDIIIGAIGIIPAEEKNLLLNIFNDTKSEYPKDKTIIQLFEEQVEKTPDNIAVVFENVVTL